MTDDGEDNEDKKASLRGRRKLGFALAWDVGKAFLSR